jgi:RNA polymerase sigma-70 factor (ECF subfamily)
MRSVLVLLMAFREAKGHRDVFDYLYGRYKGLLFHKAWEILHDHMLAEDAVSEAYIRIYRNLHKIDDPDSPRCVAFMATIARNVALTMLRKRGSEATHDLDDDIEDDFDLEESVLASIGSEEIYRVLAGLDEQLRTLFILKYAYDLPHDEIAAQMGLTTNNVTVKLHRAKKRLASMLLERVKEGVSDDCQR